MKIYSVRYENSNIDVWKNTVFTNKSIAKFMVGILWEWDKDLHIEIDYKIVKFNISKEEFRKNYKKVGINCYERI